MTKDEIIAELRSKFPNSTWAKVGSRVICDSTDSDDDRLVLTKLSEFNKFNKAMYDLCFDEDGGGYNRAQFNSFKLDDLNIIVTDDYEFFNTFLSATMLSRKFSLKNKEDRVLLHNALLFGEAKLDTDELIDFPKKEDLIPF